MKEEEIKKYQEAKLELQEKYDNNLKKAKKKIAVFSCFAVLAIVLIPIIVHAMIYDDVSFLALYIPAILFIVFFILIIDQIKKAKALEYHFRYQLGKLTVNLEDDNVFAGEQYKKDINEISSKNYNRRRLTIIISIILIAGSVFGFAFNIWLHKFTADDWQKMPWKRPYMIDDLFSQQKEYETKFSASEYNLKFMTEEEMDQIFIVKDGKEYEPHIVFDSQEEADRSKIYFAYYDEKENKVFWLVFTRDEENTSNWGVSLTYEYYQQ